MKGKVMGVRDYIIIITIQYAPQTKLIFLSRFFSGGETIS